MEGREVLHLEAVALRLTVVDLGRRHSGGGGRRGIGLDRSEGG